MASQARAATVLCCLVAFVLAGSVAASDAHKRACGAAFGVLQRCTAAADQERVRGRCCGLLEIFQRNGCLCPDCPPGASLAATSAKGLLLGAELSPLMELCTATSPLTAAAGSLAAAAVSAGADGQQQQPLMVRRAEAAAAAAAAAAARQQAAEEESDEDSQMAEMAGRAAWAQDPRSRLQQRQQDVLPKAFQQQVQQREVEREQQLLMNTPAYDYDNMLSDADAAFMLVDPRQASRYASRAVELASRMAAELAAELAQGGTAATAAVGQSLQARLARLLALGGGGASDSSSSSGAEEESLAEAEDGASGASGSKSGNLAAEGQAEVLASAAAMSDDSWEIPAGQTAAAARSTIQLAAAEQVPRTPEQRRAAALAAAVERQQAQNLARRGGSTAGELPSAGQAGFAVVGPRVGQQPAPGGQRTKQDEGQQQETRKLSVDITIDAVNPEAARRMVGSIAVLLRSWQAAAGSASSQAELAAALEQAAAEVAAAAAKGGTLGRAGLQPKQVLVQQYEEGKARTCACMVVDASALREPAEDVRSAIYQRYLATRLALCRFACRHEHTLSVMLVFELGLCAAWLAVWLLRQYGCLRVTSRGGGAEQATDAVQYEQRGGQFLIATASDPQWHAELKEPLLSGTASSSSCSSC